MPSASIGGARNLTAAAFGYRIGHVTGKPPPKSPNVILILCDDLGYGDLSCYGSPLNHTPHIDGMARDGVRFSQFYAGQPLCSPSRAALLTGCYPRRVGLEQGEHYAVLFPGEAIGLSSEEITLATLLRSQGYATKIVGKWHLGDQKPFLPLNHGFDSHFGLAYSNDMRLLTEAVIDDENLSSVQIARRRHFPPLPLLRDDAVSETEPDQATLTDRYTDEALEFIRANREGPFFLFMSHMYVHLPLYAPDRFLRQSNNGRYGAVVEHLDHGTGRILEELERLDIAGDTLVVFTSDNGSTGRNGGSNGPLRGGKGSTWEGGMREPCIMRWPGRISPGGVCGELATMMDLMPTLVALAGGTPPTDRIIDGKDIGGLMQGGQDRRSPHDSFFYYSGADLEAVRSGRFKLFLKRNELYDLEEDPGEEHNLFEEYRPHARELMDRADECRRDLGDALTGNPGVNRRPPGRVDHPVTLTDLPSNNRFVIASYD